MIAAAAAVGAVGAWAYLRAGASVADVVRDTLVGWSFAGAGVIAWWRRPGNGTGRLMVAEGMTWFLGNLQASGVPVLIAAGAWWEGLNLAVLAHLLLVFPDGRLPTRAARRLVGFGYGLVAVGGLVRALLFDPELDGGATYLSCRGCGSNPLLITEDPALFDAVDLIYRMLGILLTFACAGLILHRWRRSSRPARRTLLPVGVAIAITVIFVGWDVLYAVTPSTFAVVRGPLTALSDVSQAAVPYAFLLGVLRLRLRRSAVGTLVVELDARPTPDQLRGALARVLDDPSVQFGVWDAERRQYVDPDGAVVHPQAPGGTGTATYLWADHGRPAAVIIHDAALREDAELLDAVIAAVRLALENGRLRSQRVARGAPDAEVAARAWEAADRERRRIERDLHDGAQTHLLFALMTLRRVERRAHQGMDRVLRDTVAVLEQSLRQALDELRDLARGIYPEILGREGLGSAVVALAERSAVRVVVDVDPERFPKPLEAAAYFTVCEALVNAAKHASADVVTVSARRAPPPAACLVVEVVDDGVGGAQVHSGGGLSGLRDRVGAVGGRLQVVSPAGGGTRIRAELPCA